MNLGNLGIALGAATNEWSKQRDQARADEQLQMQKQEHGWKADDQARRTKIQGDQDAIMEEARQAQMYRQQLKSLPDDQLHTFAQTIADKYNTHPAYDDGMFGGITTINGKPMMVHGSLGRNDAQIIPLTREALAAGLDHLDNTIAQRLAMTSPEGYQQYRTGEREYGLKTRQVGAQETTANAAMKNANTQESWRGDQAEHNRGVLAETSRHNKASEGLEGQRIAMSGRAINAQHALNPFQAYQLQQMQAFDNARAAIVDSLNSGNIDYKQAERRLNALSLKYGGQMKEPKDATSPEQIKEYRTALVQLGPQPAPLTGMLGGVKNQGAIDKWNAAAAHLRQVYGVPDPDSQVPVFEPPPTQTTARPDLSKTAPEAQPRTSALPQRRSIFDGMGMNYNGVTGR